MVAPGRTHAIAGVIAHSRAIVSSANPRVLVIFMIVLLPLTTRNNDTPSNYNLSSPLTMAAVTVITALRLTETTNPNHPMKPIERLGEPSLRKNTLTLECIPGLILLMVQSKGLRSGTLAKAADVSPDTIRHYEKIGVLPRASRTESGYRVYPASAVERVLVVQRALRIGFTLAELAEVLKARDAGGAPCRRVYQLAQEKLKSIEADIEALKLTRRYVQKVLADWEKRTQSAGPGQQSHLLYSLTDAIKNSAMTANQFRRRKKR